MFYVIHMFLITDSVAAFFSDFNEKKNPLDKWFIFGWGNETHLCKMSLPSGLFLGGLLTKLSDFRTHTL